MTCWGIRLWEEAWEGFVIENIVSVIPFGVAPFYFRTSDGLEIDLVLEFGTSERWAIEIKRSSSPSISKGFHLACEVIKPSRRYVVYSGQESFSMAKDIKAVSLYSLMRDVAAHSAQ